MLYRSTEGRAPKVGFFDALMEGLAPDGGLYMPDDFPIRLEIDGESFPDRAGQLMWNFVPRNGLNKLCHEAFNFPVPLVKLSENLFVLELFHGPTLSFKDFGARFMARAMSACVDPTKKLNIIVATSGDTGSAVARAFYGLANANVFVLYPKGRVTDLQEKQMATLGGNVHALEVDGNFDDCHDLELELLKDAKLKEELSLSSANSINIGRLLPQMTYYLEAIEKLRWKYGRKERPIFVVPSGNFGNLTAGLFARKMGVPSELMVAAVNLNCQVPEYLVTGRMPTGGYNMPTISNAMDVAKPSNWARIVDLFDGDRSRINAVIRTVMASGHDTETAMKNTFDKFGYVIDPHTAVGVHAATEIAAKGFSKTPIIVLSTAHPAKFRENVERILEMPVDIPAQLAAVMNKEKLSISVKAKKEAVVKKIKEKN